MLVANNVLHKITFKDKEYRRALEQHLTKLLEDAARVWLNVVLHDEEWVDGEFPVQTGMAIASLEPLAARLGVSFSYHPKKFDPKKTPSMGRSEGRFFMGVQRNSHGGFSYQFQWATGVPHFIYNEDNVAPEKLNLTNETPWKIIEKANVAFQQHIETYIKNALPEITDFCYAEPAKFNT